MLPISFIPRRASSFRSDFDCQQLRCSWTILIQPWKRQEFPQSKTMIWEKRGGRKEEERKKENEPTNVWNYLSSRGGDFFFFFQNQGNFEIDNLQYIFTEELVKDHCVEKALSLLGKCEGKHYLKAFIHDIFMQRKIAHEWYMNHMMHHLPDTPPSKGSNPIDLGKASCNPVIIGSRVVICKRNLEELKCH